MDNAAIILVPKPHLTNADDSLLANNASIVPVAVRQEVPFLGTS